MEVKNSIAYDYDYKKELEALLTYKIKRIDKEFEILKTLLRNKNKVLTRNQIMDNVWNENDEIPYDRVIDVYIKELRKKLGLDCIKTVRSVGYKLVLDDEEN